MDKPYFKVRTPFGSGGADHRNILGRNCYFQTSGDARERGFCKSSSRKPSRSQEDPTVHLYYGADPPYYICVVVKHLNKEGFIITTYRTDVIKEGERLWPD